MEISFEKLGFKFGCLSQYKPSNFEFTVEDLRDLWGKTHECHGYSQRRLYFGLHALSLTAFSTQGRDDNHRDHLPRLPSWGSERVCEIQCELGE